MRMKTALRRIARDPERLTYWLFTTDPRDIGLRAIALRHAANSGKPSARRKALAMLAARMPSHR